MVRRHALPLLAFVALCTPAARAADRADLAEVTQRIVGQTNAFRRGQGARDTVPNAQLTASARAFAEFMARTDQYGHEADGRTPPQRATAQGYAYCLVSENIAYQYSSRGFGTAELAQRFVEAWQRSPTHRHNMLEPDATETGVAIARSARTGRYYAVQMFGRPQSLRTSFRIANQSPTALRYELGAEAFRLPPRVTRTHEQCRPEVLAIQLPGDAETVRIEPKPGERIAIERDGPRYRLVRG